MLACLEHGKPVLCEKPLTMDAESSLRVLEAEVSAGHAAASRSASCAASTRSTRQMKALLDAR